jgi:hypothetical protein
MAVPAPRDDNQLATHVRDAGPRPLAPLLRRGTWVTPSPRLCVGCLELKDKKSTVCQQAGEDVV